MGGAPLNVKQVYFIDIRLSIHLELLEEINRRLPNKVQWGGFHQPLEDLILSFLI